MSGVQRFAQLCRTIVGVGRNYKDHAAELGNSVPSKPLIFMKPPASIILEGENIEIPVGCSEIHHEIELGIVIQSKCKNVPEAEAMNYVGGYILALDMTARDFQNEAKKKGQPWAMAKCFDTSCPVSNFIPKEQISDPHDVQLLCSVNDTERQNGHTKDMIFRVPYLISYISKYFTLNEGDLILTGTPAGVGPVKSGDVIQGEIPGVVKFTYKVTSRV
ncbi:fumarylacetoacetate hydrolase domain-containing protein 1-like [Tigriopus californicus]|uniref:fumarylacetoacetate hydrolase domain-containing protein 1-like n=1 Tax=Tigriopus californicus TaxID=6832 RepID=UPI0027DA688E|nr:fumarylacetoacetate hydrolase domain-containing protein 1-like [Tigriopus californicus]XP_059084001.1 fumarylacetoacetate hydrolase domain-containing protein 1-like [Tigriopus californicus]|eukprot:TCALIF_11647-PA protein Name:"Similar to FAHD1 Acylpyruvase FAHD1, mitochondrial (Homo sapiens)" AED:0.11 eAED:0.11 QI:79/1/0.75/1/1/1/4/0/217